MTIQHLFATRAGGYLLILLAASLWGLIGPISRLAFAEGIAPLEVAFWRSAFAWLVFALHAGLRSQLALDRSHLPGVLAFAVLCVAVFYGAYQGAVHAGGAALASMLLYTAPAWVAILARMVLGERLSAARTITLALTLAGVCAVSLDGSAAGMRVGPIAIGLGLVSGLTYALYYIFGKTLLRRCATSTLFLYSLPLGAAVLWPWVDFAPKSVAAWLALATLGLLCTYGAYTVYYAGLRRLEATRAAVVATIEPVVAATVAWLWWDELFGPWGFVGAALILGAVLLTVAEGARRWPERGGTGGGA